jgi:hypothetical protein
VSNEAYSDLPAEVPNRDVCEFLSLLGFRRTPASLYFNTAGALESLAWEDDRDYRSYSGVYLEVAVQEGHLVIYTRTNAWASCWDVEKQNDTIRALRRRFGGWFQSDLGRNRYFPVPSWRPAPDESGCYLAFERFGASLDRAAMYLESRRFPEHLRTGWDAQLLGGHNPWILSNNLLLPYLVSTMEDYFKSSFIALLRYSNRKEAILKSARLGGDHLARISSGTLSVEEALTESLPFQNLRAVSEHFRSLEPQLDLQGTLRRPFRQRKVSLFESVGAVVAMRHEFIHRGKVHVQLDDGALSKAVEDLETSLGRFYKRLTALKAWRHSVTRPARRKLKMRWTENDD